MASATSASASRHGLACSCTSIAARRRRSASSRAPRLFSMLARFFSGKSRHAGHALRARPMACSTSSVVADVVVVAMRVFRFGETCCNAALVSRARPLTTTGTRHGIWLSVSATARANASRTDALVKSESVQFWKGAVKCSSERVLVSLAPEGIFGLASRSRMSAWSWWLRRRKLEFAVFSSNRRTRYAIPVIRSPTGA